MEYEKGRYCRRRLLKLNISQPAYNKRTLARICNPRILTLDILQISKFTLWFDNHRVLRSTRTQKLPTKVNIFGLNITL